MELVREAMLLVYSCETCGGASCDPDSHQFGPVSGPSDLPPTPATVPMNSVLDAPQDDISASPSASPFIGSQGTLDQHGVPFEQLDLEDTVRAGTEGIIREETEAARKAAQEQAVQREQAFQRDQTVQREHEEQLSLLKAQYAQQKAVSDKAYQDKIAALQNQSNTQSAPRSTTPVNIPGANRTTQPSFHPTYTGGAARYPAPPVFTVNGSVPPASPSVDMASLQLLMQQQQNQFIEAMKTMTMSLSPSTPIPSPPSVHSHMEDSSGRARVDPVRNTGNAALLGVQPNPLLAMVGDMSKMDMSKVRKNMSSGENTSGAGFVIRQHHWPHQLLSHMCPNVPGKHAGLTQLQFFSGMCNKMLLETLPEDFNPILQNQLRFTAFIANMSHTANWQQVLEVAAMFFRSLEQAQNSWTDWRSIEEFLERAQSQVRTFSRMTSRPTTDPTQPGQLGSQPRKDRDTTVEGIPKTWIISSDMCLLFNMGKCNHKSDHYIINNTKWVKHLCAGCNKAGKGDKSDHGAYKCPHKPFNNLF